MYNQNTVDAERNIMLEKTIESELERLVNTNNITIVDAAKDTATNLGIEMFYSNDNDIVAIGNDWWHNEIAGNVVFLKRIVRNFYFIMIRFSDDECGIIHKHAFDTKNEIYIEYDIAKYVYTLDYYPYPD